jgi:hypothetical protein
MKEIDELIKILKDNELVWSHDFDAIREPLAKLLEKIAQLDTHQFDDNVSELATSLLSSNPVSSAQDIRYSRTGEAAMYLGIMQLLAERDRQMGGALKRMFRQLDV